MKSRVARLSTLSPLGGIVRKLLPLLGVLACLLGSTVIPSEALAGEPFIAAGSWHSLLVKADGTVWALGFNYTGALGDGTTIDRDFPVQVAGLTDVVAAAASVTSRDFDIVGAGHSLAVRADGTVWAWGGNKSGILGVDPTITKQSPWPIRVAGISDAVAVAAAGGEDWTIGCLSMALCRDGTVWTWGGARLLGDGSTIDRWTPGQVPGLSDVVAIAVRGDYGYAIKADGTVWGWGGEAQATPLQLPGLTDVAAFVPVLWGPDLVLRTDGTVWTYGSFGGPRQVEGLADVRAISGSHSHHLALLADGTVRAWGDGGHGELGNGATDGSEVPVAVQDLSDCIAIAGGKLVSMAIRADGSVWSWGGGSQSDQSLGDGSVRRSSVPISVGLAGVTGAAAGDGHSLAIQSEGPVWEWGSGIGSAPARVGGLLPCVAVVDGRPDSGNWSVALGYDGTVWEWTEADASVRQVPGLSNVSAVAAGSKHGLALDAAGRVWAWGDNSEGQLGDGVGDTLAHDTPVQVPGLPAIVSVAASDQSSVAIDAGGQVWHWGQDLHQTGIAAPTPIAGVSGAVSAAVGSGMLAFVRGDGSMWVLGEAAFYTSDDFSEEPVNVQELAEAKVVAARDRSLVVLLKDGTAWTMGEGVSPTPRPVADLVDIASIALGNGHGLAVTSEGDLWAWGANSEGALGVPPPKDVLLPTPVLDARSGQPFNAVNPGGRVGKPVFQPSAGYQTQAVSVTITSPTPGATVVYTTDGSTPTRTNGPVLAAGEAVPISVNTKLRAFAFLDQPGWIDSEVAGGAYRLPPTEPPTFDPAAGEYHGAIKVKIKSKTADAVIRYTTDGSVPTPETGTELSTGAAVAVTATLTLTAIAIGPNGVSPAAVASYTILPPQPPAFTPGGGEFTEPVTVTIKSPTASAVIRYTTDGSVPTLTEGTELPNGQGVKLTRTATLTAVAVSAGLVSEPTAATYTLVWFPGVLSFETDSIHVAETVGTARIKIVRTGGSQGEISVKWGPPVDPPQPPPPLPPLPPVDKGTADSKDLTLPKAGTAVKFADGETEKILSITIKDDSDAEGDEYAVIDLTEPSGGAELGAVTKMRLWIGDKEDEAGVLPPMFYEKSSWGCFVSSLGPPSGAGALVGLGVLALAGVFGRRRARKSWIVNRESKDGRREG